MSSFELPMPHDSLFQSKEDWQFNACVHFRFERSRTEHAYIRGYKLAGDALFEKVAQERSGVDFAVYPMAYNYRHYVELSLKSGLHWASAVLEHPQPNVQGHDLSKLWTDLRPLLEQRFQGEDPGVLDNAGRLILEFSEVDPRSTAFRYSHHDPSQKNPALTPTTESVTLINLRNLHEVMGRLYNFLDGVLTQLHVDWDDFCESKQIEDEQRREYEAEWQAMMCEDFFGNRFDGYE